jgi:hypothetical protein
LIDKIIAGIASQGTNYTLSFKDQTVYDIDQATGGTMNFFSEIGPPIEMTLKPQLSGPGGSILSTWPLIGGGYWVDSGTSMSTPHVAGAYALIKSQHPSLSPLEIGQLLQNTATPLQVFENTTILSTAMQQGAGLIDVFQAIQYETRISPSELSLKDSSSPTPKTITIDNKSNVAKTYTLGHQGSAQLDALPHIYDNLSYIYSRFRWTLINNPIYATAKFSTSSITLQPLSSSSFTVQIIPPVGLDPNKLPTYSGYVTIQEGNNKYVVPYVGVCIPNSLATVSSYTPTCSE